MAQRLGAKCQTEFTSETTHVIARVVRRERGRLTMIRLINALIERNGQSASSTSSAWSVFGARGVVRDE